MAFGTGNTIGTGVRTANGTSTTITTSAGTLAGDVILVFIAKDNTGTSDADNGEVTNVTDNASGGSNVYKKAGEWTNTAGSASDGATVALWYSKTERDLASSSTITVTHSSVSDVALSAWKITTGGTGVNFSPVASATPVVVDGTAHGASISISSLEASVEHLFVRATAIEDEALTTDTATASYQAVSHLPSTTSGANAANIFCSGEFRILTATSSTSNPTYTTAASTQSATVFIAFRESTPVTPTPGAGSLTITGQSPSLVIVTPVVIAVGAGALTITGNAPEISRILEPGSVGMTLTGQAPSMGIGFGVDAAALTFSGQAPTASIGAFQAAWALNDYEITSGV